MARTKTDKQTQEVSNTSETPKPNHGLAFTSQRLQECKDIDQNLVDRLALQRIRNLSWLTFGEDPVTADVAMIEAVRLYESLEPQDGIEAMLSAHMVGSHLAVMSLFERANRSKNLDAILKYMKGAAQFEGQFLKQVATLDKHRGRNPQKVVVEHVNVEAGGQAIVGHVETKEPKS
jgi:hypothetical protein